MTLGLVFWILMLLTLIFGYLWNYRSSVLGTFGPMGNTILWWLLFFILGWGVFGPPIRG
jgi:hypothetical protein